MTLLFAVDLLKKDSEIKLLLVAEEEKKSRCGSNDSKYMKGVMIRDKA